MPPRNAITRFSDRAADYARARPSYPAPAIDAILEGAHAPGALTVADLGAGTGIASRLLADREPVAKVIAIEPNAEMRAAAPPHPRIARIDATGERTSLDDASVDLVVCAQAFHWLDAPAALAEFARILDPASPLRRVALMWNQHDTAQPAMAAYRDLMARHAIDPPRSPWNLGESDALENSPLFTSRRRLSFPNTQTLTLDALLARAFSASYIPNEGPAHEAARAELRTLFHEHATDGQITLPYQTVLHVAERRA